MYDHLTDDEFLAAIRKDRLEHEAKVARCRKILDTIKDEMKSEGLL
jgi:hypothetical protein